MLKTINMNTDFHLSLCVLTGSLKKYFCMFCKYQRDVILNPSNTHAHTHIHTHTAAHQLPGVYVAVRGVILDFQLQLSEQTVGKSVKEYSLHTDAETLQVNINKTVASSLYLELNSL